MVTENGTNKRSCVRMTAITVNYNYIKLGTARAIRLIMLALAPEGCLDTPNKVNDSIQDFKSYKCIMHACESFLTCKLVGSSTTKLLEDNEQKSHRRP